MNAHACINNSFFICSISMGFMNTNSVGLEFSAVKRIAFLQNLMGLCGELLTDAWHKIHTATFPPLKPPTP